MFMLKFSTVHAVFSKYLTFLPYVLAGFVWAVFATPAVGWIAKKFKFIDMPPSMRQSSDGIRQRKWHTVPTPRLGGIVILAPLLLSPLIFGKHPWIIAFTIALAILMILGILDDKFEIGGKWQMIVLFLASLITVVFGGAVITNVQNPLDSLLQLEIWPIKVSIFGWVNTFYVLAVIISVLWLLLVSNAINWTDNIGGVAASITGMGLIAIFLVAVRSWDFVQARMAALLLGTILGFLPFNIIPEKIFIGGSALALGFTIGTLSIVEKTKLSVWFIVFGLPLIDLIFVLFARFKKQKPKSLRDLISILSLSGKEHLAFRMAEAGLTKKQIWLTELCISLVFGIIGLAASGLWLTVSIFIVCGIMTLMYLLIKILKNKIEERKKTEREATPEERYAY